MYCLVNRCAGLERWYATDIEKVATGYSVLNHEIPAGLNKKILIEIDGRLI